MNEMSLKNVILDFNSFMCNLIRNFYIYLAVGWFKYEMWRQAYAVLLLNINKIYTTLAGNISFTMSRALNYLIVHWHYN